MARWLPSKELRGKDVFIIGGGPSLSSFNWDLLRGSATIGCNTAFRLGAGLCHYCIFGDLKFFETYKHDLQKYRGKLVTNHPSLLPTPVDWILTMGRLESGLSDTPALLAWNGNTGAAAINLAYLLGADRILLLGFDGSDKDGKNNWHNESVFDYHPEVHLRHAKGFDRLANALKERGAWEKVINLNPLSKLEAFQKDDISNYLPLKPKPKPRNGKNRRRTPRVSD